MASGPASLISCRSTPRRARKSTGRDPSPSLSERSDHGLEGGERSHRGGRRRSSTNSSASAGAPTAPDEGFCRTTQGGLQALREPQPPAPPLSPESSALP